MNKRPSTAVPVTDLNRSVAFYTEMAGFQLVEHRPEADVAVIESNGYLLLLAGPGATDIKTFLNQANEVMKPGAVVHLPPPGI